MIEHGSLIVGFSFTRDDIGTLIVGRKEANQEITVINAFSGKRAWELYQELVTGKNKSV